MQRRRWFSRAFGSGLPADAFPDVLERLRGTPARLEERVRPLPDAVRAARRDGAWSIQENAGHLLDLEPLWAARVEVFAASGAELPAADLDNRATHAADHNARDLEQLLAAFRAARGALVARLEQLGPGGLAGEARHPRLDQPMTIVDHLFFVAEHDDHHLARITELLVKKGV